MTQIDPSFANAGHAPHLKAEAPARTRPVVAGLLACAVIFLCVMAFNYGRDAQMNARLAETSAVEQETHAFCTGLGIAQGTDVYQRCESGLVAIRLRQEQRLAAEQAGLI
jgi:hypothetical protein